MRYAGYHDVKYLPLKRHDQILVWKGTKVNSTNPKKAPFYHTTKITLAVVDHLTSGITEAGTIIANPQVVWADGNYYNSIDINDLYVEKVKESDYAD